MNKPIAMPTATGQRPMLVDAHLDLAFNALTGFDHRLSLDAARESDWGRSATTRRMTPTVTFPALRQANVRVVFGTLFVMPYSAETDMFGLTAYSTADEAHDQAQAQINCYRQWAADGDITLIGGRTDLRALLDPALQSTGDYPIGVVPLMEGADPIRTPDELQTWFDAGLRLLGPAWSATRYCGGTHAPGPLTPAGRELMGALEDVGMALDTSHLAEESFWQALALHHGPVCASHANCRVFVPTDRQLSDDMIRALIERDAVIGVVVYNKFLEDGWMPGDPKAAVTLQKVVQHIEHICELAGDTRHVGIGSDLDGGFGQEGIPAELDSCMDLPLIGTALQAAGWSDADIDGVLGANWLRWLERALPAH